MTSDNTVNETALLLRESMRSFIAKEGDIQHVRTSLAQHEGLDRATWSTMGDNGFLGLLFPEDIGGFGLGFAEATIILEELGRAVFPEPFAAAIVLAAGALSACENKSLQEKLLPAIISGTTVVALAWQENNGDYDPDSIKTRAVVDGDSVRISGIKDFIPAASSADGFLVTALGSGGTGLYWLERDCPGLTLTLKPGVDDTAYGRLQLDNVIIPSANIASSAGAGGILNRAVDEARLCICAELVGLMSQALHLTLDYVKQREQFGQKIASFQVIQHRLADLFIQQELSRNTLAQAVSIFDETEDSTLRASAVSAAKARASDAALQITRQAIQLHGGIGFTDECNIGLYLKRALALSAWLGNATVHRERFGRVTPQTSVASH